MKCKDKVALLTNCGSAMGRAVALALAKEGANLSLCGPSQSETILMGVAAEVKKKRRQCLVYTAEAKKSAEIQKAVDATKTQMQRIDILVNLAPEMRGMPRFMEDLSGDDWQEAMDLGMKSIFLFCRGVSRIMKDQRSGKIINLSSRGGRTAEELASLAETTAHAGLFGLTRQFAHQLGPYGINVNAIAAGIVLPGWRWEKEWAALGEDKKADFLNKIPLRRFARPEEIARVVVFLASEEASYITGATIDADGGRLMPIFPMRSETL